MWSIIPYGICQESRGGSFTPRYKQTDNQAGWRQTNSLSRWSKLLLPVVLVIIPHYTENPVWLKLQVKMIHKVKLTCAFSFWLDRTAGLALQTQISVTE